MADFNKSMIVLDSWEGGYDSNSKDPGGETYCGISRRMWPNWAGWMVVDHLSLKWNEKAGQLDIAVENFYYENFWNKQSFKDLDNQDIADKIFQHYVNMGFRAIKLAQAVIFYGFKNYDLLKGFDGSQLDGQLGVDTASRLNSKKPLDFLERYIEIVSSYYKSLIKDHPQLKVFEHEWLLRARTIGKRP
jgi:lysozyme family protein